MRKLSVLICLLFSVFFGKAQCNLSLIDTVHIACNGGNEGMVQFEVVSQGDFIIKLNNGQQILNSNTINNLPADQYLAILYDTLTSVFCLDTVEFKIKEPAALELHMYCEGLRLNSEVLGGVEDYSYSWINDEGFVFSESEYVNFQASEQYVLEVLDQHFCKVRDTVFVNAEFVVDSLVGSVPFEVQVVNLSSLGNYYWDFGGVEEYFDFSPSHEFDEVGEYEISLIVVDDKSDCEDFYSLVIHAQGFELSLNDWEGMYDVFTPNDDGVNDTFSFLENHAISWFSAAIYTRYGKKVYEWMDSEKSWDGKNKNGKVMSDGVYFYSMRAIGENGQRYEKKGVLTLISGVN